MLQLIVFKGANKKYTSENRRNMQEQNWSGGACTCTRFLSARATASHTLTPKNLETLKKVVNVVYGADYDNEQPRG